MALVQNILLVDDSPVLLELLGEQFAELDNFALTTAQTGEACLAQLETKIWDLLLLDVRLPDQDGLSLCRALRKQGKDLPIVMLTALSSEEDIKAGFAAGATDYIVKPFRFAQLLARLQAHLHFYARNDTANYTIGKFAFSPAHKQLQRGKEKIALTDKEADILLYFCRHRGQEIARATLLGEVWGYHSEVSTHTLETHIYRLRQKLEADPKNPHHLRTKKQGYCLDD